MQLPPDQIMVGILTTQEVVAVGLRTILESAASPVPITTQVPSGREPDVVLYDVIKLHVEDGADLEYWLKESVSTVIAIDRTLRPELGLRARERGVMWSIDLGINAEELVSVIQEAITGNLEDSVIAQEWEGVHYPGQAFGLSLRESQVLVPIVQGRSNQQIADELFLSINSVKTHIRSTYRKLGVTSRSQAVSWGVQHGFPVDRDKRDE